MSTLPIDLVIFCILTRLDATDVGRCKAVCKEWRLMISTPEFESAHYSRLCDAPKHKTLLIRESDFMTYPMTMHDDIYGPHTIHSFPFSNRLIDVEILAHLDGLLCIWFNETSEMPLWNPTTNAYTRLSSHTGHGYYSDGVCAVGLYKTLGNDYNVLHITKTTRLIKAALLYYTEGTPAIKASVYSRNLQTWRDIEFNANPEYGKRSFCFSQGTFCGSHLYFTVCECWLVGRNVVIAFDTITESVTELPFPSVPSVGIFQGVLANVQNTLHMVLSTGVQDMTFGIWVLRHGEWVSIFSAPPIPPIPFPVWLGITHYMTNGTWFVMSETTRLYEIPVANSRLGCFYSAGWFRSHRGTVFVESVISPSFS